MPSSSGSDDVLRRRAGVRRTLRWEGADRAALALASCARPRLVHRRLEHHRGHRRHLGSGGCRKPGTPGFGLDSGVESLSAAVVLWRLYAERRDPHRAEAVEQRALRLIGVTFFVLAVVVAVDSIRALVGRHEPEVSVVGIVLTAVSIVVMQWLAREASGGDRHGEQGGASGQPQTSACVYLSIVVLCGLLLNAAFGWWWADPLARSESSCSWYAKAATRSPRNTPTTAADGVAARARLRGCEAGSAPVWACEAHHVVVWEGPLNGEPRVGVLNLVLLCWHHHHMLHKDPGWRLVLDPTTRIAIDGCATGFAWQPELSEPCCQMADVVSEQARWYAACRAVPADGGQCRRVLMRFIGKVIGEPPPHFATFVRPHSWPAMSASSPLGVRCGSRIVVIARGRGASGPRCSHGEPTWTRRADADPLAFSADRLDDCVCVCV